MSGRIGRSWAATVVTDPLRRYLSPRFEALASELRAARADVGQLRASIEKLDLTVEQLTVATTESVMPANPEDVARSHQAQWLERVDVTDHNRRSSPASFGGLMCHAPSAAECRDPAYLSWWRVLKNLAHDAEPGADNVNGRLHRKIWEWAYIAQAVTELGHMEAGRRALGFGVGNEPLPALFARAGLDVLATDQPAEAGDHWDRIGQLTRGISELAQEHIVPIEQLRRQVTVREVDMNQLPDDLGTFDVVWSACVIEHLGSPARGLEFVLDSCELLRPGGVAVHTTELELTRRDESADYGHCAVYRREELLEFADRLHAAGYEADFNFHVSMDSPADRWISLALTPEHDVLPDLAHLKLVVGDSVSTSYGISIRKPT